MVTWICANMPFRSSMLCNIQCTPCKVRINICGNVLCASVKLTEPPDAEPHVRWCERSAAKAASYSIITRRARQKISKVRWKVTYRILWKSGLWYGGSSMISPTHSDFGERESPKIRYTTHIIRNIQMHRSQWMSIIILLRSLMWRMRCLKWTCQKPYLLWYKP